MTGLGKLLVIVGILIVIASLVFWLAGNKLSWFGHLPGDIRISGKKISFYFPITSMIIISVIISFIIWLVRKFFG